MTETNPITNLSCREPFGKVLFVFFFTFENLVTYLSVKVGHGVTVILRRHWLKFVRGVINVHIYAQPLLLPEINLSERSLFISV